jgi:NAD(P)-dependent dehydrogenase (short-subunit alcohol dehydrogenase family)
MTSVLYNDLRSKHVVVTGAASGIGAAIARAFGEQAARVSALDILPGPNVSDTLFHQHCDLRDPAAIEAAIANCRERFGPIDVLVNNAASDERHTLLDVDSARWDDLMAVNLKAAFLTARAVAAEMVPAAAGNIINISSNCFLLGLTGYPVYATAKAGLWGMTRSLARELGASGIRVNCLVPGWVATERQRNQWMTPEALAECLESQCLKEVIQPDDIASACLFLASSASRMITGQMIVVDGGRA